jgi:DNA replication and repair protein RecF
LALKLAQFQYLLERTGQKPILLLDDIFDKLDMLRVQQLIALVGSDRFGQVLLTDTQPGRVQAIFDQLPNLEHRIFHVENGSQAPRLHEIVNFES